MPEDHQWFLDALAKLEAASPEEKAELTDNEVFAIGVSIVAQKLKSEGAELLQVYDSIDSVPSIWFKRNGTISYLIISVVRYPNKPLPPKNTEAIHRHLLEQNASGYWVGVALAHEFEVFDPDDKEGMPLMKGFGVLPSVTSPVRLEQLSQ